MQKLSEILDSPEKWIQKKLFNTKINIVPVDETAPIEYIGINSINIPIMVKSQQVEQLCLIGAMLMQLLHKHEIDIIKHQGEDTCALLTEPYQPSFGYGFRSSPRLRYPSPYQINALAIMEKVIEELFPERVHIEPVYNTSITEPIYFERFVKSRQIIMRFNDHPTTTFEDVQQVIGEYDRRLMLASA